MRERENHLEICLAWKEPTRNAVKRGVANVWNGFGGGMQKEDNGSYMACATRELLEESGVTAVENDTFLVGDIIYNNGPLGLYKCKIFISWLDYADPRPSKEMSKPTWFRKRKIPYGKMMDSDSIILPMILDGRMPRGTVFHNKRKKVIGTNLTYENY